MLDERIADDLRGGLWVGGLVILTAVHFGLTLPALLTLIMVIDALPARPGRRRHGQAAAGLRGDGRCHRARTGTGPHRGRDIRPDPRGPARPLRVPPPLGAAAARRAGRRFAERDHAVDPLVHELRAAIGVAERKGVECGSRYVAPPPRCPGTCTAP
ncbi:hypothetical protein ACWC5C_21940 [Streptomyces sp. NPDC001700]